MKTVRSWSLFRAELLLAATATLGVSTGLAQSGERLYGNSSVAPVYDEATGSIVYISQPLNAPFPVNVNPKAISPVYAVLYPVKSTIAADSLNCQPTNCDHLNVIPFLIADYGELAGTDPGCRDFNGGQPCSPLKGHNHLIGVASSGGDFNQAHTVRLVLFTSKAFLDLAINTKITTLTQLQQLLDSGEVVVADTPITFHGSIVSEHAYLHGAPLEVPYP